MRNDAYTNRQIDILREDLDIRFRSIEAQIERRVSAAIHVQESEVDFLNRKIEAASVALEKRMEGTAEQLEHRLEGMNEFREQNREQAATMVHTDVFSTTVSSLGNRIDTLSAYIERDRGANLSRDEAQDKSRAALNVRLVILGIVLTVIITVVNILVGFIHH